ncbi:hypothetical protein [Methylocystis sp.]|uniref:hypothetical protein n=1 Tax=Methylocystis sp. TaxID=1911079 RepID=UPI003DA482C9
MKNSFWVFVILGAIGLASCQSTSKFGSIDQSDRSITMPPGSAMLLGPLKQKFSEAGWRMSVDRGPDMIQGSIGEKTALASGATFLTRYRLLIKQRQYDICIVPIGGPAVDYDLSVIDNRTGEEIITQNGSSCMLDGVAQEFVAKLGAR